MHENVILPFVFQCSGSVGRPAAEIGGVEVVTACTKISVGCEPMGVVTTELAVFVGVSYAVAFFLKQLM